MTREAMAALAATAISAAVVLGPVVARAVGIIDWPWGWAVAPLIVCAVANVGLVWGLIRGSRND